MTVGLDIGSFLTKAVVISWSGKTPTLVGFGSIKTPNPGFSSENDIDLENLGDSVHSLLNSLKAPLNSVSVSIPESKVYSRVVPDLPYLSDDEISSAIKYTIDEFVPLPPDQVEIFWQVLNRSEQQNHTIVLVIAVPKKMQEKYLKVLNYAKIKPAALETEMISVGRLLVDWNIPTSLAIQFGALTTDISVITEGVSVLTRSLSTGGLILTRSIAQSLSFEPLQAEEYKKVYGMIPNQLDGKIFQIIKPLIELIAAEADRIMQAYHSKSPNTLVQKLVLIGGGAKLPGLAEYLDSRLGLQTTVADPWALLQKDQNMASKLVIDPVYSIATGLALRRD